MPTPIVDQELLARFVPMSALAPSYLRELSSHATLIELNAGDTLDEELRTVEFIYYLVEGELHMSGGDDPETAIKASDSNARFSLAVTQNVGRHTSAVSDTRLLRLQRAKISTLLIWAQASNPTSQDLDSQALRDDITALLLHSRLFARISPSNIERIGQVIESVKVNSGDVVIRQGEVGDYYYIIESGRCEVLRENDDSREAVRLAQLGPGESFGEEALITDSQRNATVRMLTDGVLLRLTRDYFITLISAPLLHEVSHERAEDLLATGARLVDVRLREEFERDGLDDAINMPLGELRSRMTKLPKDGSYITVCNTGQRAQAGAFLLSQRGLHACSLRDGIATRRPDKRGIRAIEESLGDLQADLLRADAALEDALKTKALADATKDVAARTLQSTSLYDDATERLQLLTSKTDDAGVALRTAMERKRELESAIRDVQAHEVSSQRAAQAEVERMRVQAQTRLESEKQRLSERYRDASSQLEQVEQARRDAETRFEEERVRIEQELEQARRKMDAEAERIRQAIAQAQCDAKSQAENIRIEHQQLESAMRQRTEETLRHEREHLEEEFSRSIAAHERARQTMDLAEAERIEAHEETQRLRADTELELRQREENEERTRDVQVRELQSAREAAQQRLQQAQRARDEAMAQHKRFSATLGDAAQASDPQRERALRDEIEMASETLANADSELGRAHLQHTRAARAEHVAEQTHAAAAGREDELRLQIFEEMQTWIEEEQTQAGEELAQAAQYARELERIHAAKERKRIEELHADENMFSDIEGLLNGEASDDPLNTAMRTHTIAEEKAQLVQRAKLKVSEDAARARAALENS
jgi:CRP-like cAMP-binding protein